MHCIWLMELYVLWTNALKMVLFSVAKFMFSYFNKKKRMNMYLPSNRLVHLVLHSTERESWGCPPRRANLDGTSSRIRHLGWQSMSFHWAASVVMSHGWDGKPTLSPVLILSPLPFPETWLDTCFRAKNFTGFWPRTGVLELKPSLSAKS